MRKETFFRDGLNTLSAALAWRSLGALALGATRVSIVATVTQLLDLIAGSKAVSYNAIHGGLRCDSLLVALSWCVSGTCAERSHAAQGPRVAHHCVWEWH